MNRLNLSNQSVALEYHRAYLVWDYQRSLVALVLAVEGGSVSELPWFF
jgi:hypothetical protein